MRFSDLTPPHDSSHPRPRQRNADQLHHLIIPAPTATPTAPLTTVGNPAASLAWDPGVRHPLRQRRTHTPVPHALPPLSSSPPLLSPTAEDARSQHKHRRPPRSFRASFSKDTDVDVDTGDEGGTDDEYEDADGSPTFLPSPRLRSAPRFSHPHNLRSHSSGVNTTRISAQPVCHLPLSCTSVCPLMSTLPPCY